MQSSNPAAATAIPANPPRFQSAIQSSNSGTLSGVTSDSASGWLDGSNAGFTVRRQDGSSLRLRSATHRVDTELLHFGIHDHDTGRGDGLIDFSDMAFVIPLAWLPSVGASRWE